MKEFVEYMVKALVDEPDAVEVNEVAGESGLLIEVKVAEADLGRIIGKQGRIANAMRTLVKAAALKDEQRATLEILT